MSKLRMSRLLHPMVKTMVREKENLKFVLYCDLYESIEYMCGSVEEIMMEILQDAVIHQDVFWEMKLPEARAKLLEKIEHEITNEIYTGIVNNRVNNSVLTQEMIINKNSSILTLFLETPETLCGKIPVISLYSTNSREDAGELLRENRKLNLREYLLTEALLAFPGNAKVKTDSLEKILLNAIESILGKVRFVSVRTKCYVLMMEVENFQIEENYFAFGMTLVELREEVVSLPGEIVVWEKDSAQHFFTLRQVMIGGAQY